MKLSFHGGARDVTGACYLLKTAKARILIDCGLFQGCEECPRLNQEKFQFNPKEIDALFVTHGHVDHIGRIPKLVKDGFRGKIYSTPPTKGIAGVLLEDAYHLEERDGNALYDEHDIADALGRWNEVQYGNEVVVRDIKVTFRNAGHILGSAFIEIEADGRRILFTGDFGNSPSILLPEPKQVKGIDYLIIESTYGNRTHESDEERRTQLERAVEDAASRRGTLIIPAFATERTQDILFLLNQMLAEKRIPDIPVFVDSPLAIKVTKVFEAYPSYYREEIKKLYLSHPHLFQFKKLRLTESVDESKRINDVPPPKVVIAGSGMMTGGRILHHLRRYLGDSKSIVVVVGYQAAGSLGRRLLHGETRVKILSDDIIVQAEIRKISGFSAHADNPQLFSFVEGTRETLKQVFVVQGEDAEALHLVGEIRDRLGISAEAPLLHDTVEFS